MHKEKKKRKFSAYFYCIACAFDVTYDDRCVEEEACGARDKEEREKTEQQKKHLRMLKAICKERAEFSSVCEAKKM